MVDRADIFMNLAVHCHTRRLSFTWDDYTTTQNYTLDYVGFFKYKIPHFVLNNVNDHSALFFLFDLPHPYTEGKRFSTSVKQRYATVKMPSDLDGVQVAKMGGRKCTEALFCSSKPRPSPATSNHVVSLYYGHWKVSIHTYLLSIF
ncbi:hypothetical protein JTE90_027742 [Oedothorax gibbosus]|uniref:Uncharacterized protein n=1 Tax=Oedothorax gibbosus TaxID=931172 RepID=A0AAV6UHG7_9ARAC|nr:hypothetical protein JTE90_027742 [Oedothorax gibbosus]